MKSFPSIYNTTSVLQVPPNVLYKLEHQKVQYFIEWERIPQNSQSASYHDEFPKLYKVEPSDEKNTKFYICSPFDIGYTITAKISVRTINNLNIAQQKLQTKIYTYGQIQNNKKLMNLQKQSKFNIQFQINKNNIGNGTIQIHSNLNQSKVKNNHILTFLISVNEQIFTFKFCKEQLIERSQPLIKIYQDVQEWLDINISDQNQYFMEYLKSNRIFYKNQKYLRIICSSRDHRDLLIYKILGLIKSTNLECIKQQESYCTTSFGNKDMDIINKLADKSIIFNEQSDQNKGNIEDSCKDIKQIKQQWSKLVIQASKKNQKLDQSNHLLKQFNEDFDKLFSGGHISDVSGPSPSDYMEQLYNILYTPYSKSRKQSFSSMAQFLLKQSKSQKSISKRKQDKTLKQSISQFQVANLDGNSRKINQRYNKNSQVYNIINEEQQQQNQKTPYIASQYSSTYESPQFISSRHSFGGSEKQQQLLKRIQYLVKINEKLVQQNQNLKKMLQRYKNHEKVQQNYKMQQIKQMALNLVERLGMIEHQPKRQSKSSKNNMFQSNAYQQSKKQYYGNNSKLFKQISKLNLVKQTNRRRSQSLLQPSTYFQNNDNQFQNLKNFDLKKNINTKQQKVNTTDKNRLQTFNAFEQRNKQIKTKSSIFNKIQEKEKTITQINKNKQQMLKSNKQTHSRTKTDHLNSPNTIKFDKVPKFLKSKQSLKIHEQTKIIPQQNPVKMTTSYIIPRQHNIEPNKFIKNQDKLKKNTQPAVINQYVNKGHITLNYYHNHQN